MKKYFLDTEFIEDGKTIDLISIGIVCEDDRELYLINYDCDYSKANQWVRDNVIKNLPPKPVQQLDLEVNQIWKTKKQIAEAVLDFIKGSEYPHDYLTYEEKLALYLPPQNQPQFWGEWCSYDWVVFCQLFGTMMDLPKGFPMRCNDVIQYAETHLGIKSQFLPESMETEGNHNALLGAKTVRQRYYYL